MRVLCCLNLPCRLRRSKSIEELFIEWAYIRSLAFKKNWIHMTLSPSSSLKDIRECAGELGAAGHCSFISLSRLKSKAPPPPSVIVLNSALNCSRTSGSWPRKQRPRRPRPSKKRFGYLCVCVFTFYFFCILHLIISFKLFFWTPTTTPSNIQETRHVPDGVSLGARGQWLAMHWRLSFPVRCRTIKA